MWIAVHTDNTEARQLKATLSKLPENLESVVTHLQDNGFCFAEHRDKTQVYCSDTLIADVYYFQYELSISLRPHTMKSKESLIAFWESFEEVSRMSPLERQM